MKTSLTTFRISSCEHLKAGSVLISRKKHSEELLNRSVILILEHDETGSTGIILNKAGISPEGTDENEPLHYGGTYDTHRIGVLLDNDHCASRAVKICEGIYYSERCEVLERKNFRESMISMGLKAFIGFTVWQPGQLEEEVQNHDWWISEPDFEELRMTGKYTWERMTIKATKALRPAQPAFN
jgi:putative transcriptional regulator